MSWLERLKNLEAAETVLPELTEAPSVSFVSAVLAPAEDCASPSVSFVSAESGDADFSAGSPEPVPALAVDNSEPTGHCPACGSPSWWRSPSSPTWCCSCCSPRDRSRAEAVESVTVAGGQWAPGTRPPADPDDGDRPLIRPADGRVQDAFGAWRTPAEHERIAAYDRHHWTCTACIRAGRGYGARCEAGARLHAAMRASR